MADAPAKMSADGSKSAVVRTSWGFWASLAWVIAAFIVPNIPLALALGAWVRASRQLGSGESVLASTVVLTTASYVPTIFTLYFAARIMSPSGLRYLGLQWPKLRYILLGFLCWLLYVVVVFGFMIAVYGGLVGNETIQLYRSALQAHALLFLLVCTVLIAPLGEEIIFRGFLFRGWSESPVGALGAILLTSFAWVLIHLPNNPTFLSAIFVLGLMLGWLRWLSGSIFPTTVVHVLTNAVVMLHASNAVSR